MFVGRKPNKRLLKTLEETRRILYPPKIETAKWVKTRPPIKKEFSNVHSCKKSDHDWKMSWEEGNVRHLFCRNCFQKKEEQIIHQELVFKVLPTDIKKLGARPKEEIKPDEKKYRAPEKPEIWHGNHDKKRSIFVRCMQNGLFQEDNNISDDELILKIGIIPLIIIDECVSDPVFIKLIVNEGYDVEYLGRGLEDLQIKKMVEEKNAVLVTEDNEFFHLAYNLLNGVCFVSNNEDPNVRLGKIIHHMRKFEQKLV